LLHFHFYACWFAAAETLFYKHPEMATFVKPVIMVSTIVVSEEAGDSLLKYVAGETMKHAQSPTQLSDFLTKLDDLCEKDDRFCKEVEAWTLKQVRIAENEEEDYEDPFCQTDFLTSVVASGTHNARKRPSCMVMYTSATGGTPAKPTTVLSNIQASGDTSEGALGTLMDTTRNVLTNDVNKSAKGRSLILGYHIIIVQAIPVDPIKPDQLHLFGDGPIDGGGGAGGGGGGDGGGDDDNGGRNPDRKVTLIVGAECKPSSDDTSTIFLSSKTINSNQRRIHIKISPSMVRADGSIAVSVIFAEARKMITDFTDVAGLTAIGDLKPPDFGLVEVVGRKTLQGDKCESLYSEDAPEFISTTGDGIIFGEGAAVVSLFCVPEGLISRRPEELARNGARAMGGRAMDMIASLAGVKALVGVLMTELNGRLKRNLRDVYDLLDKADGVEQQKSMIEECVQALAKTKPSWGRNVDEVKGALHDAFYHQSHRASIIDECEKFLNPPRSHDFSRRHPAPVTDPRHRRLDEEDDEAENQPSIRYRVHDSGCSSSSNQIQSILISTKNLDTFLIDKFLQAAKDDKEHEIHVGEFYKCVGFPSGDEDPLSVYVEQEDDAFNDAFTVKLQLFISHLPR
jgi:hypothetical protein